MTHHLQNMIIVDTNAAEDFLTELQTHDCPVTRERLDVGDVKLCLEDSFYVIERKTWADLAGSIGDGRWQEQKSRMIAENTQYAILLEGPLPDWVSSLRNFNPVALWGATIKAQLRDKYHVFHTADKASTVRLIAYLYKNFTNHGFDPKTTSVVSGTTQKRKRDNLNDADALYVAILSMVPGMSKAKAMAVKEVYPTLRALMDGKETTLADIKCGSRKLGSIVAKRILQVTE
jgi:ERCC4-type nuclease